MATVKFDMRDPETKATVAGWAPDTEYVVRTTANPATGMAETVETEEAEPESPESGESAGPAAVKSAMGAGMGAGMMAR